MKITSLLLALIVLFTSVGYTVGTEAAEETYDAAYSTVEAAEEEAAVSEVAENAEENDSIELFDEVSDSGLNLTLKSASYYHESYISGSDDGCFHPDDRVTRAEAAQMLYNLLETKPDDRMEFTDVSEDDWYYDAIGLLAAGGILDYNGTRVGPNAYMSRGQFAAVVSRFYDDPETPLEESPFSDVDENTKYYDEILKASQLGIINGLDDGTFQPGVPITRAEAVTIINRITGRASSNDYDSGIILPLYEDLDTTHWAYSAIMEASLSHTFESTGEYSESWTWVNTDPLQREAGLLFIGFDMYYISEETGLPVADETVGTLYFGPDGRYTCGDEEVDAYVMETLTGLYDSGSITDSMTQLEKLRAVYNYTRDSFTYLKRHYYSVGETGWELEEARTMFSTRRGNCYCYASVFYYLSRQLGYDGEIISGTVGYNRSPHGWVEIVFDDTVYIFDTELEMSYRKKGIYYYDFFMMSYSSVPWPYYK